MKTTTKMIYTMYLLLLLSACGKSDFLNKKPNTNIVEPKTLADFQNLLDNATVLNQTGGLAQLASDDYKVSNDTWNAQWNTTDRNSYIWAKDIYGGDVNIRDWNELYAGVFYANSVLDGLNKLEEAESTTQGRYIKGWALFARAYAFYDLTRNFCKAYDASTAQTDLGIPLRLTSNIDYTVQRSTLQQSLEQIFNDLDAAENLLPAERPAANLNRPSKIAVFALYARIYLDMRNYSKSENYADKCLELYRSLIDYNTLNKTASVPFTATHEELIYNTRQITYYNFTATNLSILVSPDIISLYDVNDLRLILYFTKQADGSYYKKRGYAGDGGLYPFTGLATDEIYLIKSECLARRGQTDDAMGLLNQMLIKRWNPDATSPAKPYQNLTASSPQEALSKILTERRKELVWRGLRWYDLKRLNKEGANITLNRTLNGVTYTLPPNDPRYVFPIPSDEIALSGLEQNQR